MQVLSARTHEPLEIRQRRSVGSVDEGGGSRANPHGEVPASASRANHISLPSSLPSAGNWLVYRDRRLRELVRTHFDLGAADEVAVRRDL